MGNGGLMGFNGVQPSGMTNITMENHHLFMGISTISMAISIASLT